MKLGYELNMTQTQKLIMTPELRQAINILQYSALELNNFIQDQLLENPLLEITEDNTSDNTESNEVEGKLEEWQEYLQDKGDLGYQQGVKEQVPFEQFFSQAPTLQDFLEEQILYQKLNDEDRALAQFIIGNLNSWGYFEFSIDETAQALEIKPEKLEEILEYIQNSLEPDGIGARNLSECLIIQLRKKNELTPILEQLACHHLEDIAQGRLLKVAQTLEISVEETQKNVDILKTLNPKPASGFGSNQETRFIVPDLSIEKIDGEYIVLVNDNFMPRLMVSEVYKQVINNSQADELTRTFIERKLQGALWLIKSIEQRRMTLYRIANALIEVQKGFFDLGEDYLLPLNLKDVAEKIEVHESTVSRAIANKYVQTPSGLYPLKFFFPSGITNKGGTKISSQVIKNIMEDILNTEDPKAPYSDQMLCNSLQERGIKIARRTVSKYREELGILSAAQRRRY